MKNTRALLILMTAPVLALGACNPQTVLVGGTAAAAHIFDRPDVNLKDKNYAATDYLMQAGGNFASKRDYVKAVPLQNDAAPELSTKIGRVIAQHAGERMQQLGYNVDVTDVSLRAENDFPYAPASSTRQPDYVLSGTYHNGKHQVDVKLRLVETGTGRTVGQFDYPLPLSQEIQNMARPKAKIYRTTGQPAQR